MSVADGSALLSARLREAWACVELDGLDRCVVVMRGSWSLRGGSVPVVIGVCGYGVRACRSSGGVKVVGPVCSSHDCWPVAVLSSRLVVTGPLLLCRCSTVGLLGSGSLVHRSSCHWSVTALLLLCLIAHRCSAACLSPVRRSSAVRSSLVRLLLCRCSVCLAVAFLSLVCHWSVCSGRGHWFVARPWLARLFVLLLARPWLVCCWFLCSRHGHWCRHYFVCSYAADPWFVTRPSVRVRVAGPSARLSAWVMAAGPSLIRLFVHHCSVCSGRGHWSVGRTSLVRLLESSLSCHSAPRGTVSFLFDCSTPHSALLDSTPFGTLFGTPFGTPFGSTRLDLAGLSDVCILLYCSAARLYSTRPARIPILSVG